MNCDQARIRIGAEPNCEDAEVLAHVEGCPSCAQFRRELQDMEVVIAKALQINVERPKRELPPFRRRPLWAAAASLLVTVCAGATLWLLNPAATLAEQVVRHVREEPASLEHPLQDAEPAEVATILARSGVRLKPGATRVSYAMRCWLRGRFVPHLVVKTDRGPATVLVLTSEPARQHSEKFEEDGFYGVVVPAPRGVLVVLGHEPSVASVAATVIEALEYKI